MFARYGDAGRARDDAQGGNAQLESVRILVTRANSSCNAARSDPRAWRQVDSISRWRRFQPSQAALSPTRAQMSYFMSQAWPTPPVSSETQRGLGAGSSLI